MVVVNMKNNMVEQNKEISPEELKRTKESRKYWMVTRIAAPLIIAMYAYDALFPEACVEKAQVVDIISVEGTQATFKFSNGETRKIGHPSLKRGDTYCMSSERQNKYFK